MSKKLKKWQVIEKNNTLAIKRHKEATRHLINQKNEEIKKLKETIEGMKELDAVNSGIIQILSGKCMLGYYIGTEELSYAIKHPERLEIKIKKNGFRIKAK